MLNYGLWSEIELDDDEDDNYLIKIASAACLASP